MGGGAVQGAFYSFFIAVIFLASALAAFLYVTRCVKDVLLIQSVSYTCIAYLYLERINLVKKNERTWR